MQLVVNKWLPQYFLPAATREEKLLLQAFLQKFIQRDDQIVVRRPSEFHRKIYRYAKTLQGDYEAVTPMRNFIKLILEDSNRCLLVDGESIELPANVDAALKRPDEPPLTNYESDRYLFEAAAQTGEKTIVTTDGKLVARMADGLGFRVVLLEDFLKTY